MMVFTSEAICSWPLFETATALHSRAGCCKINRVTLCDSYFTQCMRCRIKRVAVFPAISCSLNLCISISATFYGHLALGLAYFVCAGSVSPPRVALSRLPSFSKSANTHICIFLVFVFQLKGHDGLSDIYIYTCDR